MFGVNKAADEFGVPRSTLKDRLSGKVVHGTKSGPTPYLSGVEEDELVNFLLTSTDICLPKTRKQYYSLLKATLEEHRVVPAALAHARIVICALFPDVRQ